MKLPNGIETNNKPIAGIDWSRFEVVVSEEGRPPAKFKTLAEAAEKYPGYIWALECTADSFELQNRQLDIDAIKENNIEAYCFNPKFTSNYRIIWNDIPKTDEADSVVIRRIFCETPLTPKKFAPLKFREEQLRSDIQKRLIEDRQYQGEKAIEVARKYLNYDEIPEQARILFYDSATLKAKKPRNPKPRKQIGRLLMAAEKVRELGLGWRTFRRQVGNYGQGFGCMLRSEYYWWLVRTVLNSRQKANGLKKESRTSHIDPKTKEEKSVRLWTPEEIKLKKEVMREFDKNLKWLWRLTSHVQLLCPSGV